MAPALKRSDSSKGSGSSAKKKKPSVRKEQTPHKVVRRPFVVSSSSSGSSSSSSSSDDESGKTPQPESVERVESAETATPTSSKKKAGPKIQRTSTSEIILVSAKPEDASEEKEPASSGRTRKAKAQKGAKVPSGDANVGQKAWPKPDQLLPDDRPAAKALKAWPNAQDMKPAHEASKPEPKPPKAWPNAHDVQRSQGDVPRSHNKNLQAWPNAQDMQQTRSGPQHKPGKPPMAHGRGGRPGAHHVAQAGHGPLHPHGRAGHLSPGASQQVAQPGVHALKAAALLAPAAGEFARGAHAGEVPVARVVSRGPGPQFRQPPNVGQGGQGGQSGQAFAWAQRASVASAEAKAFAKSWVNGDHLSGKVRQDFPARQPPHVAVAQKSKLDVHAGQKVDLPDPSLWKRFCKYLDTDGDGKVSFDDLISSRIAEDKTRFEDVTNQHRPYFTLIQIIVCAALWAWSSRSAGDQWMQHIGGLERAFPNQTFLDVATDCVDKRWEAWRMMTYQYNHGNVMHIASNSAMMLVMGAPVERFHGALKTILVFTSGVLGSALVFLAYDPHRLLVGMSGGCYALCGAHLGALLLNWSQVQYRWPKFWGLVATACVDVVSAKYGYLIMGEAAKIVAHSAHFGGYLAGLSCALVLGRSIVGGMRTMCIRGFIFFVSGLCWIFCVCWLMQWPLRAFFTGDKWCWIRQGRKKGTGEKLQCLRCFSEACIEYWKAQWSLWPADAASCENWMYSEE